MMMSKQRNELLWAVGTLGLSVLVKGAIVLYGVLKEGGDLSAPVPYKVFLAAIAVEAIAILYLLAKVLWLGTVAQFG